MTPLAIPVFTARPAPARQAANRALHPRLVAAIRWDYEYGLMSRAEVVAKYRLVAGRDTVRDILERAAYPEVKAQRHALAWCKRTWRLK